MLRTIAKSGKARSVFVSNRIRPHERTSEVIGRHNMPLVIDQSLTNMLVLDPLDLQAAACIDFALG